MIHRGRGGKPTVSESLDDGGQESRNRSERSVRPEINGAAEIDLRRNDCEVMPNGIHHTVKLTLQSLNASMM